MPFPQPTDADYCLGSSITLPQEAFPLRRRWYRCPECDRLIAVGDRGKFFPHVSDRKRARKGDAVQEGLDFYGCNRREGLVTT